MPYVEYDTATLPCWWAGSYAGFMNVQFSFNLTAVLYHDEPVEVDNGSGEPEVDDSEEAHPWKLSCTVSDFSETHDWGTAEGGGFINVGGLNWGARIGTSAEPLSSGLYDTAELCLAQRNAAFGSSAAFDELNIWGIYASDEGSPPAISGTWVGSTPSYDMYFDTEPFEIQVNVVSPYTRWYDWQNEPNTAYFEAGGDFSVSFQDLFPDYIPWERREGTWVPNDTDGHDMARREAGAWVTMTNKKNSTSTGENDGWRRVGGAWRPSPLRET